MIDVGEEVGVDVETGLFQRLADAVRLGRAALDGDHLLNIRVVLVRLVHAFSHQDGFLHSRRRRHALAGQHFDVVPGLALPGVADGLENEAVDAGAVSAHGVVEFPVIEASQAAFGHWQGQAAVGLVVILKIVFMVGGQAVDGFADDRDVGQVDRTPAVGGRMGQVGDAGRVVAQETGADQVGGKNVPGSRQDVAAPHFAVEPRPALDAVDAVDDRQHGRHGVRQPGDHEIQAPDGIGVMAFFAGFEIDQAFEVFNAQADDRLVVGLHDRQVHQKIAFQGIGVEIQFHAVTQVKGFKGPFHDVDRFDAVPFP